MPTVQLRVEFDNGKEYVSEVHEIEGLGVLLVDTNNDTVPDLIKDMQGADLKEDVSAIHPDDSPDIGEIVRERSEEEQ